MTTASTVSKDAWAAVVRRRVSVGGRVADGAGAPASGGQVALTPLQEGDATQAGFVPRWEGEIRADGLFFILDAPPGNYLLDGHDARGRTIAAQPVSIAPFSAAPRKPLMGLQLVVTDA